MKPILEVQHLAKKFKIHHMAGGYLSLRESLLNVGRSTRTTEEFWALNDVSFSVNPGESIGIIGKNGAGKSTLLKILSKITPPTKGRFVVRGRIASLLEVGTGFHPELTGRENIFFNGSLLGMKRKEIQSKFDEIVDFSGTERFLDTPLKHYSSGMQLRLAFAVAAHLDPEILIIDEVLAVGDSEFQKKCIGKMTEIRNQGRTILFVSHNMAAIKAMCTSGIWLKEGKVNVKGDVHTVMNAYINDNQLIESHELENRLDFQGSGIVKVAKVIVNGGVRSVKNTETVLIEAFLKGHDDVSGFIELAGNISTNEGVVLHYFSSKLKGVQYSYKHGQILKVQFEKLPLQEGRYHFSLELKLNHDIVFFLKDAFVVDIVEDDFYRSGIIWNDGSSVLLDQHWS